jgi:hypothetical protein
MPRRIVHERTLADDEFVISAGRYYGMMALAFCGGAALTTGAFWWAISLAWPGGW